MAIQKRKYIAAGTIKHGGLLHSISTEWKEKTKRGEEQDKHVTQNLIALDNIC